MSTLNTLTPYDIETVLADHEWSIPRSYIPSRVFDPAGPHLEVWSNRRYRDGVEADRIHYASEYLGWDGWDEFGENADSEATPITIDGVPVTVKRIGDTYTGGEGGGEDIEMIFEISDGLFTRYFRKTGYYYSYDGSNWDGGFSEVKPAQKTITVYEAM
ncbi:hypothetical protein ACQPZJ_35565 [Actinoplanes sp. CA-054009]